MSESTIVSPDGNWRWDGTTWQPTAPTDQADPTTPPAATDPTTATPDPTTPTPTPPVTSTPVTSAPPPAAADTSSTAAASGSPGADVGDVVTVQTSDDATPYQGLVVGLVEGNAENGEVLRETGVLVVPLPDATFVPNAALKD